mmetsp:Transcript_44585/g.45226  ORF Transcript_44585/g.45226 Transcript_44585/m.45226 type:complete len:89 (-) Transcript_44585:188-454(-)
MNDEEPPGAVKMEFSPLRNATLLGQLNQVVGSPSNNDEEDLIKVKQASSHLPHRSQSRVQYQHFYVHPNSLRVLMAKKRDQPLLIPSR